jgi:hypothetical protein
VRGHDQPDHDDHADPATIDRERHTLRRERRARREL